jgi:hypothetical protein
VGFSEKLAPQGSTVALIQIADPYLTAARR